MTFVSRARQSFRLRSMSASVANFNASGKTEMASVGSSLRGVSGESSNTGVHIVARDLFVVLSMVVAKPFHSGLI